MEESEAEKQPEALQIQLLQVDHNAQPPLPSPPLPFPSIEFHGFKNKQQQEDMDRMDDRIQADGGGFKVKSEEGMKHEDENDAAHLIQKDPMISVSTPMSFRRSASDPKPRPNPRGVHFLFDARSLSLAACTELIEACGTRIYDDLYIMFRLGTKQVQKCREEMERRKRTNGNKSIKKENKQHNKVEPKGQQKPSSRLPRNPVVKLESSATSVPSLSSSLSSSSVSSPHRSSFYSAPRYSLRDKSESRAALSKMISELNEPLVVGDSDDDFLLAEQLLEQAEETKRERRRKEMGLDLDVSGAYRSQGGKELKPNRQWYRSDKGSFEPKRRFQTELDANSKRQQRTRTPTAANGKNEGEASQPTRAKATSVNSNQQQKSETESDEEKKEE